ncbi:12764_t:CDS:2 [Funneliformis caledonium]|uniref:12764_t:CDS:1 n=1 Tax=Funneliformis caledonium TaxID=1117310 RepID=A0A9N8V845_9GLOM|nr:12764_t:CDS:2 [Funneliformis caledonium]
MTVLSSNLYFTFHAWISSHYTLDHQSLQNLIHYLTLLQELHRKSYEFNKEFYNSIQKHIDGIIKSENDQIVALDDVKAIEFDEDKTLSYYSTLNSSKNLPLTVVKRFYPKRVFEYLNGYEDNLYKLILKKQLEIIYEVGDYSQNIESLRNLLAKDDQFSQKDASLFLIIIYSTYQLLEKLEKFGIKTNIDLIYNLGIFMKRMKCITLDLVNQEDLFILKFLRGILKR